MRSRSLSVAPIELHGWDAHTRSWHGPDELSYSLAPCRRIVDRLRRAQGSWHGRLRSNRWDELMPSFDAWIRDLGDAGLAVIDMEGSSGGPLQIILAVPQQRLTKMRPDLAFEFVSFVTFLEGHKKSGSEHEIHDYVQQTLSHVTTPATFVFSIESLSVPRDCHLVLSEHAENLAISMIAWMAEKDCPGAENSIYRTGS